MRRELNLRQKAPRLSLQQDQKQDLDQVLIAGARLMPHHVANCAGLHYWQALGILVAAKEGGLAELRLLIYHQCEPDIVAGALPYGDGFPALPWICPNCDHAVYNYGELGFDFEAELLQDVELI